MTPSGVTAPAAWPDPNKPPANPSGGLLRDYAHVVTRWRGARRESEEGGRLKTTELEPLAEVRLLQVVQRDLELLSATEEAAFEAPGSGDADPSLGRHDETLWVATDRGLLIYTMTGGWDTPTPERIPWAINGIFTLWRDIRGTQLASARVWDESEGRRELTSTLHMDTPPTDVPQPHRRRPGNAGQAWQELVRACLERTASGSSATVVPSKW